MSFAYKTLENKNNLNTGSYDIDSGTGNDGDILELDTSTGTLVLGPNGGGTGADFLVASDNLFIPNTLSAGGGAIQKNVIISPYPASYGLTNGDENVFLGYNCGGLATTATGNVSIGSNSLPVLETGDVNVSIGNYTMYHADGCSFNVAVGSLALYNNSYGSYNTAIGHNCLKDNTTGESNVGVGYDCLNNNISGNYNTAVGDFALENGTIGIGSTAIGYDAGLTSSGNYNVFMGYQAGENCNAASNSVSIGADSVISNGASNQISIGFQASTTVDSSCQIGNSSLNSLKLGSIEAIKRLRTVAGTLKNSYGICNTTASTTSSDNNTLIYSNLSVADATSTDNVLITSGSSVPFNNALSGYNTCVGRAAGNLSHAESRGDVMIGYNTRSTAAGQNYSIAIGAAANTTGISGCIAIGRNAAATGNNCIMIGSNNSTPANVTNATSNSCILGDTAYTLLKLGSTNILDTSKVASTQLWGSSSTSLGANNTQNFIMNMSANNSIVNGAGQYRNSTLIGYQAGGTGSTDLRQCTFIGQGAGSSATGICQWVTCIGNGAGQSLTSGTGCLYLGRCSASSASATNELVMSSADGSTSVYGGGNNSVTLGTQLKTSAAVSASSNNVSAGSTTNTTVYTTVNCVNIGYGSKAGTDYAGNTNANTNNVVIGSTAKAATTNTTTTNRVVLGYGAVGEADNSCMIGNTGLLSISPASTAVCSLGASTRPFSGLWLENSAAPICGQKTVTFPTTGTNDESFTVATTGVLSGDLVFLQLVTYGGAGGSIRDCTVLADNIINATSFSIHVIKDSGGTFTINDTAVYNWWIIHPTS